MTESPNLTIEQLALRDPRGPFTRRFAAWLVDCVLAALAMLLANKCVPEKLLEIYPSLGGFVALVVVTLYFWVPEALWGATLGKASAGVRVVDRLGRPPGFGKSLVRTLLRFIEANPLLFGALPAGLVAYRSKTGRRVGDILAKTYVLLASDLRDRLS